jgi:hypothetical protein
MVSEPIDKLKRKMFQDDGAGESQGYAEPMVYMIVRSLIPLFRVESFKTMSK